MEIINFREWQNEARLYVLAVLFAMPWCSESDLERVGPYGRSHFGKELQKLERDGLVWRKKAGNLMGTVWRWALTGSGVEVVCRECEVEPNWTVSRLGLLYLLLRMDTLEPIYSVAPNIWGSCNNRIEYGERPRLNSDVQSLWVEVAETQTMQAPRRRLLTGFRWYLDTYFDGVAVFEGEDEIESQVPIVRCGLHARQPDPTAHGTAYAPGSGGFSEQQDGFLGLNTLGSKQPGRPSVLPAAIIAISNDHDVCSRSLAFYDYSYPAIYWEVQPDRLDDNIVTHVSDTGRLLSPLNLRAATGRILEPAERGAVRFPDFGAHADSGSEPEESTTEDTLDRIFDAVNGAIPARVFREISAHNAIEYRELVQRCGKSDRAGIRRAVNRLLAVQLVKNLNDTFYLDERGIKLAALRDGVPADVVALRFKGMRNNNGTTSRRWLKRQARIARVVVKFDLGEAEAIPGFRPVFHPLGLPDRRVGLPIFDPDAWVRFGDHWAGLEYVTNTDRLDAIRKRLSSYSSSMLRCDPTVLVVCETSHVENRILQAGLDLESRVLTTTEHELLTDGRGGIGPIWRFRGKPCTFPSLAGGAGPWSSQDESSAQRPNASSAAANVGSGTTGTAKSESASNGEIPAATVIHRLF